MIMMHRTRPDKAPQLESRGMTMLLVSSAASQRVMPQLNSSARSRYVRMTAIQGTSFHDLRGDCPRDMRCMFWSLQPSPPKQGCHYTSSARFLDGVTYATVVAQKSNQGDPDNLLYQGTSFLFLPAKVSLQPPQCM